MLPVKTKENLDLTTVISYILHGHGPEGGGHLAKHYLGGGEPLNDGVPPWAWPCTIYNNIHT